MTERPESAAGGAGGSMESASDGSPDSVPDGGRPTDSPADDASVRLEGVTVAYPDDDGDVRAVDDVSLSVRDGEFLVLVGPSGCGKTTALRAVAGLESPTDGRVLIDGEDVTDLEPRERDVAMVFQNYALYPHKTVYGNVAFPLEIRKNSPEEIERRVQETARLLDIDDLLDRKPGALSGGQQQRVALGRAIVREPAAFLMDEPLSNLDAKLRTQMRVELNDLHERVGRTTIYVTHDQAEAMTLGDRVAVMNDGRIQQIGSPQRLYREPVNRFVAGFVGDPPMNFFDVDLLEADDGYRVRGPLFEFSLPRDRAAAVDRWDGALDSIALGVRPEDVDLASERDADDGAAFSATVKLVEPLGSITVVTLVDPSAGLEPDREFAAVFDPDLDVVEGESIDVRVNRDRTHVFDDGTGANVTVAAPGGVRSRRTDGGSPTEERRP